MSWISNWCAAHVPVGVHTDVLLAFFSLVFFSQTYETRLRADSRYLVLVVKNRHWRRLRWNMKQMAKQAAQKTNCKKVDAIRLRVCNGFCHARHHTVCVCHYQFESRNSWTEKWIHFVLAFGKTSCSSGWLLQLEIHPSICWISWTAWILIPLFFFLLFIMKKLLFLAAA